MLSSDNYYKMWVSAKIMITSEMEWDQHEDELGFPVIERAAVQKNSTSTVRRNNIFQNMTSLKSKCWSWVVYQLFNGE